MQSFPEFHIPTISEVACAAALATYGHSFTEVSVVGSMDNFFFKRLREEFGDPPLLKRYLPMRLFELDVSTIPYEDMANLTKCAKSEVFIVNVQGDLSPVLRSIKSGTIFLSKMDLSSADTSLLVSSMINGAKIVHLMDKWGEVTLDMEALQQYDGRGKCGQVLFHGGAAITYSAQIKKWAKKSSAVGAVAPEGYIYRPHLFTIMLFIFKRNNKLCHIM